MNQDLDRASTLLYNSTHKVAPHVLRQSRAHWEAKKMAVQLPNLTAKVQLEVLNVKLQAALLCLQVD